MKRRKREAERKKLKSKGTERIDREREGGGGGIPETGGKNGVIIIILAVTYRVGCDRHPVIRSQRNVELVLTLLHLH